MKLKSLLLSLLATVSLTSIAAEVSWKHIPSYREANTVAFIDTESQTTTRIQGKDYISALFLIVADKEFDIIIDGKPVKARSTVKRVIVECRSSTISMVEDLYFKEAKPVDASKPVASTGLGSRGTMPLSKSHFVYVTLCALSV
jgi:hypothetical protein